MAATNAVATAIAVVAAVAAIAAINTLLLLFSLPSSVIAAIAAVAANVAIAAIVAVTCVTATATITCVTAVDLSLLKFFLLCTLNQSPEDLRLSVNASNHFTFLQQKKRRRFRRCDRAHSREDAGGAAGQCFFFFL